MNLEETTQLYASVLRQLLPVGGYDASPNTEALSVDVYAHAKLLAQADIDAKRLLTVLEELPPELLSEYETEYGLPLKCTVNAGRAVEERLEILKWVRSTRNVLNRTYFDQVLKIFGVELFEFKKFKPMQCTSPCNVPVNTEQLRYKIRIVIPDTAPADMDCIIENYFPGYLRIDVLKVPLLFKTSKPYPLYFEERVSAVFGVAGVVAQNVRTEITLNENISTSFGIVGVVAQGVRTEIALDNENISTSFGIMGVTAQNVRTETAIDHENISTSFGVMGAQQMKILISHTAEIEKISTNFALTAVQIIN